ncbi:MAG: signal peptide peptidase SppA [Gemmatimonadetes bacterium]|jgi:protease IV|nr:signal peptide peptidase SppA [Gemmatimonadota bacterium]
MNSSPGIIRRTLYFMWRVVDVTRRLVFNLLFLFFLMIFLMVLLVGEEEEVPEGAALVLAPEGEIVEQLSYVPPAVLLLREGVEEEVKEETLLRDLIDAIELAREDERIGALVLDLDQLTRAGLSKLQEIGAALERFRESGKPVVASGDFFTQGQYYLAAHASEVYLHPMGGVLLYGYGTYPTYMKSALERLLVRVHAFKVGSYKTALEPFLRDDMSDEAREANLAWLEVLWAAYRKDVTIQRALPEGVVDGYVNDMVEHLDQAEGDVGQMALDLGLVDDLKTRSQVRRRLVELVGAGRDGFRQIRHDRYLELARPASELASLMRSKVGVVVGRGMIVDGKRRAGQIGGDTLAGLLKRAREDGTIRAVVLRIDSGGGSAFASEVIRQEVLLMREAGKPVVASMSSVAASGGYWMAAPADEIWAAPTTITGSIGIFGAMATFERSLDAIGVHADGVGTTDLAGSFDPRRPLNPLVAGVMQRVVERGYGRFLEIVAEGRGMSMEEVAEVAEGRVWAGETAQRLGLVDGLGGLEEAIAAAAQRAGLEDYDVTYVEREPTPREQLITMLASQARGLFGETGYAALKAFDGIVGELDIIGLMNDPQGAYAWCLACGVE